MAQGRQCLILADKLLFKPADILEEPLAGQPQEIEPELRVLEV